MQISQVVCRCADSLAAATVSSTQGTTSMVRRLTSLRVLSDYFHMRQRRTAYLCCPMTYQGISRVAACLQSKFQCTGFYNRMNTTRQPYSLS